MTGFTMTEVARRARVNRSTLHRWVQGGRLRPQFIEYPGKRPLWTESSLWAVIEIAANHKGRRWTHNRDEVEGS